MAEGHHFMDMKSLTTNGYKSCSGIYNLDISALLFIIGHDHPCTLFQKETQQILYHHGLKRRENWSIEVAPPLIRFGII